MKQKRVTKQRLLFWLGLALLLLGSGAFVLLLKQDGNQSQTGSAENATEIPAQVVQENGKTIIQLDPALQAKVGIVVEPITAENHSSEQAQTTYGVVMLLPDVTDLLSRLALARADVGRAKANAVSARGAYQRAQAAKKIALAALQKVEVNLDISHRAYERLRTLNQDNRNVSAKTVESAEGMYQGTQSDIQTAQAQIQSSQADMMAAQGQMMLHQAELQGANDTITSIREAAYQRLGPVVSTWMMTGSPQFTRLLQRQDVLVQIALPSAQKPLSPLRLQTADSAIFSGRYVAPAIQIDPKIQGVNFIYLVSNSQGTLMSGMNVIANLPVKATEKATLAFSIPPSAVVWLEGTPWVYVQQKQKARFIRQAVQGRQAENRWRVQNGFRSGDRLVTQGAQLLLSQEFQAQSQGE